MSESLDTIVTACVRRADEAFEKVGGSSRHWVRECLFPALEEGGLAVVTIAEREVLAKRVEEVEAERDAADMRAVRLMEINEGLVKELKVQRCPGDHAVADANGADTCPMCGKWFRIAERRAGRAK